ncbi:hypothetical protein ACAG26_09985 [Mycobacterium sp. pUA109]|uniref:hypothetical protein n=1 Tax=Mycobacterium sp. pUA109 TaxID=3238982 RepID=UPI00351AE38C
MSNWGATRQERGTALPCDALLPNGIRADRAISIAAPPAIVFGWLCQLRVAPYSYDLLDNLGRRSPRRRTPALTHLAIGQRFMTLFTLHSFADGEHITLRSAGVAVTYAVRPLDTGARLQARVRFGGPRILARLLAVGDLVMMRKQLLTLRAFAAREARNEMSDTQIRRP